MDLIIIGHVLISDYPTPHVDCDESNTYLNYAQISARLVKGMCVFKYRYSDTNMLDSRTGTPKSSSILTKK